MKDFLRRILKMGVGTVAAWVLLHAGHGVPAAETQVSSPPHMGEFRWTEQVSREERRERVRMFRMWKLIETIDLKDTQSERFFLALNRYDAEEGRVNGERERLSNVIKGMLDRPDTPDKAIQDTVQAFRQMEDLLREARGRFRAESSGILSVKQQARLLLFEQRFDVLLRNEIVNVMIRRGIPGGWGPATDPWGPQDRWRTNRPGEGAPPSR